MNSFAECDIKTGQMLGAINFESPTARTPDLALCVPNGDDEAKLIAQARNGSSAAIEQLVGRYERRLFRLAQNTVGNHEDAEEVVQSAFVKAFRNLAAFRGESRFYTWLVRIALNEALMKIRGKRLRVVSIDAETDAEDHLISHELEDRRPNPEQCYSQEELRTVLAKSIGELAPAYRVVFQLRDVEGFSTEEAARVLGLSHTAVKTRLRRGRLHLRHQMDSYFRSSRRSGDTRGAARYSQVSC